jgi:hypothetical protein
MSCTIYRYDTFNEDPDFELFESAWDDAFGSGFEDPVRRKRAFDELLWPTAAGKDSAAAAADFFQKRDSWMVAKVLGSLQQTVPPN